MVTMMNDLLCLAALTVTSLLGCSNEPQQSSQTKAEAISAQPENIQQPQYLIDKGIKYPYFSYETNEGKGLAMFIHPMFDAKSRVLALEYRLGDNIRELFGEELFGESFTITQKNGILESEAFLIYRPLDIKANWKWSTTYANEVFECKLVFQYVNDYKVQCISPSYTLAFIFNSEHGVTSFQDFCYKNNICTYYLKSGAGIFSPYHLQSMK
jgi:hypothetical protein